jgi:integrase
VDLPYLELFRARGRQVAYYRRDGARIRLRDAAGQPVDPANHPALVAAWQAAHTAHEAADKAAADAADARRVRPQSISDLIARYRASPEWSEKAPGTKGNYEKALKPLEADFGRALVIGLQRNHVTQIRNRYATRQAKGETVANARQANHIVTVLSILLSYAVNPLGWRPDNPALKPKRLKVASGGYRPWTYAEFQTFWTHHGQEWRDAALLAVLSSQRGQDQVAMQWSDYDGARVYVVQQKGGGLVKLWIPAHEELKLVLDDRRKRDRQRSPAPLTILSRPDGKPWPVNAFQKAAGVAIREAGLTGIVWHGLRGSAMSWAADGGASQKALMAMSGHSTSAMAEHYTRGAGQEGLARQAVNAIVLPAGVERKKKVTAKPLG